MALHFKWKNGTPPVGTIDVSVIHPNRLSGLSPEELSSQEIHIGSQVGRWRDVFTIEGEPGEPWHLPGCANYLHLGKELQEGRIVVDGHAGDYAGLKMRGGLLEIQGSAGFGLGAEMSGGLITVAGDTGAQTGGPSSDSYDGMSDGEILIHGTAGPRVGFRMRRGLIAARHVAEHAGYQMLAGTIVVVKSPLIEPGFDVKRGSILFLDAQAEPSWTPYYQSDCIYPPTIVKIILGRLQELGFPLPENARHARYHQYSGDRLSTGKGEIFHRIC